MRATGIISAIIGIQLVIDVFMWYFALANPYSYQGYWAVLLAANIILLSLVMLVILRQYMKGSDIYG